MTDQVDPGVELSFGMVVWFLAGTVGLWFVFRNADPTQFPDNFIKLYMLLAALNLFAFGCGWLFGLMYRKWWATYIWVFTMTAFLSIFFWFYLNFVVADRGPPRPPSEVLKQNAVSSSNAAAALFVVLILPACCGVYFRQSRT